MDRIRVEVSDNMNQKVFFVSDGTEVEITKAVTGIDVSVRPGDIPRVTCHTFLAVPTDFEGEIDSFVLNVIPPDMIPDVIGQLMKRIEAPPYLPSPAAIDKIRFDGGLEADVKEIYDHWREERGRTRKNYDTISPNRRKKIVARLGDGFTVTELKQAISNVANDPWEDRPKHDDIPVIFRNQEQVERFLEMEGTVPIPQRRYGYGVTTSEILAEADRRDSMVVNGAIEAGERMDEDMAIREYDLSGGGFKELNAGS